MNQQQQNPIALFERDLWAKQNEFQALLPPSIRLQEFIRVAVTAANNNPDLLYRCSKPSLFNGLMKAAEDKLLPDGREGALVPYKGEAQWIPMREGVIKRLYEATGIILHTGVVYQGDEYDYERGDNPRIMHRPRPGAKRSDPIIAAYAIAEFTDGRRIRDWMWVEQIEEIRQRYARSAKGPWSDPVAYPEMAIKTVIHHLSKDLPLPNEMKRMIHRDDVLYAVGDERAVTLQPAQGPAAIAHQPARTVESVLGSLAEDRPTAPLASDNGTAYDPRTGEVMEDHEAREAAQQKAQPDGLDIPPSLDRRGNGNGETAAALKMLTDAAQPTDAGEYEGFIQAHWERAESEAQREAVRMYWKLTGGMRHQLGMSRNQEAALADQMRRVHAA